MIFSALRYPLTVQGDTLGSPVVLTVPAKGKSLTLRYRCGSREGVVAADNTDGLFRWIPPLSLAQEYPRDNRIPVSLILEQYRKGVPVASREEQILLALPGSVLPQVALSHQDAVGFRQVYGSFVQGKSRLLLAARATGTFGSDIDHMQLQCGALTGEGNELTFDLPQAGQVPVRACVWDARGRSAAASGSVTVLPYDPPAGEILGVERGESCTVRFRGSVTALAGKNRGTFTVVLQKAGEEALRYPAAQGWEETGEVTIPGFDESWEVLLEVADDFETAVFPYVPAPLVDVASERRALGIGCRAERESGICLGLPLDLGGNRAENLGMPQNAGDAVSLGYAEENYFHPRLLWENPAPDSPFPAQTLELPGGLLLIQAAVEAGKEDCFWELGMDRGLLRAAAEANRGFTRTEAGVCFGTTALGDGWAVPLRVYG